MRFWRDGCVAGTGQAGAQHGGGCGCLHGLGLGGKQMTSACSSLDWRLEVMGVEFWILGGVDSGAGGVWQGQASMGQSMAMHVYAWVIWA